MLILETKKTKRQVEEHEQDTSRRWWKMKAQIICLGQWMMRKFIIIRALHWSLDRKSTPRVCLRWRSQAQAHIGTSPRSTRLANLCVRVLNSSTMIGGNQRLFTIALSSNSIVTADQPHRRRKMVSLLTILSKCCPKIALQSINTKIKMNIQTQIKKLQLHRNNFIHRQARDMNLTIILMNESTLAISQLEKSASMNQRARTTRISKHVLARPLVSRLDLRLEEVVPRWWWSSRQRAGQEEEPSCRSTETMTIPSWMTSTFFPVTSRSRSLISCLVRLLVPLKEPSHRMKSGNLSNQTQRAGEVQQKAKVQRQGLI